MAGLESPVEESPWGVVEEEATIGSRRERRLRARGGEGMWGPLLPAGCVESGLGEAVWEAGEAGCALLRAARAEVRVAREGYRIERLAGVSDSASEGPSSAGQGWGAADRSRLLRMSASSSELFTGVRSRPSPVGGSGGGSERSWVGGC